MYEVISAESDGLQSRSHRRGVMPLVLFLNFSGQGANQSENVSR